MFTIQHLMKRRSAQFILFFYFPPKSVFPRPQSKSKPSVWNLALGHWTPGTRGCRSTLTTPVKAAALSQEQMLALGQLRFSRPGGEERLSGGHTPSTKQWLPGGATDPPGKECNHAASADGADEGRPRRAVCPSRRVYGTP